MFTVGRISGVWDGSRISVTYVHQMSPGRGTWKWFRWISSNSYDDIVFTWFIAPLPAVTFCVLTPKFSQHVYEPKYICDQDWVKFPSLVFEVWCSQGFDDAQTHSQTDRPENRTPFTSRAFGGTALIETAFTVHVHDLFNPLKGKAVKCYTSPSRPNPHFNFWHSGTLALSPERQSARMSEIKNVG